MYSSGYFATDEVMKDYVEFICSHIILKSGACVDKSGGFPMKGCYVPVKLSVTSKTMRYAKLKLIALGYTKDFTFYMSRHKSPDILLHELQDKINEAVGEIILENSLDRDKIFYDHHPLRGLKLPK
jgi:hypothetical protein